MTSTALIAALLPECFQTEESAVSHCAREATRLGDTPPAVAMRAVAEHAQRSLRALRQLADARGQSSARGATAIGRAFSNIRYMAADLMVSREKSYRGTILGAHHGLGVFLLLEDAAVASGDQGLADFCAAWLAERTTLVAEVERDLAWFASHPEVAMSRALPGPLPKLPKLPAPLAKLADRLPLTSKPLREAA